MDVLPLRTPFAVLSTAMIFQRLSVLLALTSLLFGCASTSSYIPNEAVTRNGPAIAVVPFTGFAGGQASDMVLEELEKAGYNVVDSPSRAEYVMSGTCAAMGGPLYSFAHASMTARVVNAHTDSILWLGRYGNPAWTSAISTQGDIQRGARDLVVNLKKTLPAAGKPPL